MPQKIEKPYVYFDALRIDFSQEDANIQEGQERSILEMVELEIVKEFGERVRTDTLYEEGRILELKFGGVSFREWREIVSKVKKILKKYDR
jgi:hypothetical protein